MDTLGLKHKLRELVIEPFWNYRGDETTNKPGVPIRFERFMQERPDGGVVLKNAAGQPLSMLDLYKALGTGENETYLNALTARSDDFSLLGSILIEEMVIKGYTEVAENELAWWRQLCFATGVAAANEAIKKPWVQWSGEPKPTGEGEDLPIVTIKQGERVIQWKKKGAFIRFSLEFLMVSPIPVLEAFVIEQSRILQHQECQHAVQTIVNGDVADGSNASPIIGIGNTTTGLTYGDWLRLWARGGLLGRRFFTLLSNEAMSMVVEEIEEFKKREVGGARVDVRVVNRPVPSSMDHFVSEEVGADIVQAVDRDRCMRQRVFLPLHVEGARKPENLTQGVAVATSTTFEIVDDKARVAMDRTKAFSGYGFPAWFTLAGNRWAA